MTERSEDRLSELLEEAQELRDRVSAGGMSDSLATLHDRLVTAGMARDRVEQILVTFLRAHGRAKESVADARAAYDQAWQQLATERKVGFSEYATAREREAAIDAKALKERMALLLAEKNERQIWTALEYVRQLSRGIDSVRRDIELRVRIITTESRLV